MLNEQSPLMSFSPGPLGGRWLPRAPLDVGREFGKSPCKRPRDSGFFDEDARPPKRLSRSGLEASADLTDWATAREEPSLMSMRGLSQSMKGGSVQPSCGFTPSPLRTDNVEIELGPMAGADAADYSLDLSSIEMEEKLDRHGSAADREKLHRLDMTAGRSKGNFITDSVKKIRQLLSGKKAPEPQRSLEGLVDDAARRLDFSDDSATSQRSLKQRLTIFGKDSKPTRMLAPKLRVQDKFRLPDENSFSNKNTWEKTGATPTRRGRESVLPRMSAMIPRR